MLFFFYVLFFKFKLSLKTKTRAFEEANDIGEEHGPTVLETNPVFAAEYVSQLSIVVTECDRIPKINNLEGGKVYLGSWFQPMVAWPRCFGPVVSSPLRWKSVEDGS